MTVSLVNDLSVKDWYGSDFGSDLDNRSLRGVYIKVSSVTVSCSSKFQGSTAEEEFYVL